MSKIASFEELKALQAAERAKIVVRDGQAPNPANLAKHHVLICAGTGCSSSDSMEVMTALETQLAEAGLSAEIDVVKTGCFGFCSLGPIMVVYPEGTFYTHVKVSDVPEIVEKTLLNGEIIDRLTYVNPADQKHYAREEEIPFYAKQHRVVMKNCTIEPNSIGEYLSKRGYEGAKKAYTQMS